MNEALSWSPNLCHPSTVSTHKTGHTGVQTVDTVIHGFLLPCVDGRQQHQKTYGATRLCSSNKLSAFEQRSLYAFSVWRQSWQQPCSVAMRKAGAESVLCGLVLAAQAVLWTAPACWGWHWTAASHCCLLEAGLGSCLVPEGVGLQRLGATRVQALHQHQPFAPHSEHTTKRSSTQGYQSL